MRCREVRGKLEAHLAGHLDPVTARGVDSHLRSCPRCAEQAALAREVWERLGSHSVAPASGDFAGRLRCALERERSGVARRHRFLPAPVAAAAVAVVLAAGLGVAAGRGLASYQPPVPVAVGAREPEASDYVGAGSGSTFVSLYAGFADEGAPR